MTWSKNPRLYHFTTPTNELRVDWSDLAQHIWTPMYLGTRLAKIILVIICSPTSAAAAKLIQLVSDSVWPHRPQPTRLPCPWDSPGKNTGVDCHFLLQCMKVKSESEVAQSCLTLRDPMDCSLPGSSIHGIFQARVLEWGAIAFSSYSLTKHALVEQQEVPTKYTLSSTDPFSLALHCLI